MQIEEARHEGFLIVAPSGRLDSSTAGTLDRVLNRAVQGGDTRIILDLAGVDYIGSMGLSMLVAMEKRIRAAQGQMIIRGMNDRVRLTFEISGLLRWFDVR